MAEYIPFKRVFVNGFQNNVSAMLAEIPNPRLSDDLIGGTGDMPNYPQPVDLSLHGSFDPSVKRLPSDAGSYKNTAIFETRWHNSGQTYWTNRQTQSVYHDFLRQKEQWISFSTMFYEHTTHGEVFFGLGGVGGGSISFRVEDGFMGLTVERLDDNTSTNRMYFRFGEATPGIWHDFLFYVDLSDQNDGRFVLWLNGELAKLTHPTTGDYWEVPTSSSPGVQNQFTAYPAKGYINTKIIEGEQTIDVLDWKGFTYGGGIEEGVQYRWLVGLYKSGWNSNYNTSTGVINPDTYDDNSPLYLPPEQRTRTAWYNNVKWQPVNTPMGELPQSVIFRSLDKEGNLPSNHPDDFDFSEDFEDLEITSPLNGQKFQEGSVINVLTNFVEGNLDFLVNGNIVQTKNLPPYSFTVQNYPIDDSAISISLDGQIRDTSPNGNLIEVVNTLDIAYVDGPYDGSQGVSLGNSETVNERSYIAISSNDKLQDIKSGFTISFWVKAEVGLNQRLLSNRVSGSNKGIYVQQHSGGRLMFHMGDGETSDYMYSSNSGSGALVDGDTWNHYAWTYDGDVLICYYNFSQSNSMEFGEVDIDNSNPWELNKLINDIAQASYADFRVFNYVFSSEDVEDLTKYNYIGELELKVKSGIFESDPVTINIVEELPTFTISATATTGGNVSGDGEYEENEEVTLTATPDSGYEFVRWEEYSETVSTANPYIFNAEGNRILVAVFQEIEYQLTVTYTAGGTATGSGEYKSGEQVQLTATPSSGYIFTGWYRDSTLLSTDNPYNYTTRGQADTVQARFELIPIPEFTITVIPSTGGAVSGGGVYEEGQSVTLSAMPQSGWTFVKWSNDATDNPYSFTASENLTISAIFEEVNPEVPYIIVKGKFKIV